MSSELKKFEEKMDKALSFLENELASVRAGRANPGVLDKITIDYYGVPTPIQQVAAVAVSEARILQISPWEPGLIKDIERAILVSDIGINPSNDGKTLRLVFPSPTEERRKQLAKDVLKLGEEAKVGVRGARRDALEFYRGEEKASNISEDELAKLEADIQKLTDKKVKKIDDICAGKNKEITEL